MSGPIQVRPGDIVVYDCCGEPDHNDLILAMVFVPQMAMGHPKAMALLMTGKGVPCVPLFLHDRDTGVRRAIDYRLPEIVEAGHVVFYTRPAWN